MSSWLSLYVRPFDETENYEYNCHGKLDKDNLAMVLMIVSVDVSGVAATFIQRGRIVSKTNASQLL